MKLHLPQVTLICVDGVNPELSARVLDICKYKVDFGAVKLLTHLPVESEHRIEIIPLKSLVAYSVFMLTRLHEYVDTSHVLVVQRDGWILNPHAFSDEWLELDYIAPLFMQEDKVGSGGFSMRSKAIMEYAAKILPKWNGTQQHADEIQATLGYYEDGVLSLSQKFRHFKKASPFNGCVFAQGGNRNPAYFTDHPFGFHRTWQKIDFATGRVDSTDTSADITPSYDADILRLTQ